LPSRGAVTRQKYAVKTLLFMILEMEM